MRLISCTPSSPYINLSVDRAARARQARAALQAKRRPITYRSVEKVSDILPVAVKVTPASAPKGSDKPVLSQDCMDALRAYLVHEVDKEEELVVDEDACDTQKLKRLRKSSSM